MIDRDAWVRFCIEERRRRIAEINIEDVLRSIHDLLEDEKESLPDSV